MRVSSDNARVLKLLSPQIRDIQLNLVLNVSKGIVRKLVENLDVKVKIVLFSNKPPKVP